MAVSNGHALSALLEQRRYEDVAPQLDEEELKVSMNTYQATTFLTRPSA